MEEKLKEFKSRRRREMLLDKPKQLFQEVMDKLSPKKDIPPPEVCEIKSPLLSENSLSETSQVYEEGDMSVPSVASDVSVSLTENWWLDALTSLLYFVLWIISFLYAVHLEFGFVYFVLSGLVFIYFNTRTGPKKKGEISAYSVFNPGCEAIEGTLKAEQLEREFNLIQH